MQVSLNEGELESILLNPQPRQVLIPTETMPDSPFLFVVGSLGPVVTMIIT